MQIPTINLQKTGDNINALRKRAGLSVRDVQTATGLGSAQAVYKWLNGQALPTVDNLVILSALLGTPIDQLLVLNQPAAG